jgi:gliding motility-associated protein GldM
MAGGKETPRQKMIGMMYLVLTALLALNVSSAILEKFAIVNDTLEDVVISGDGKNVKALETIQKAETKDEKAVAAKDKAQKIRELSKKMVDYLEGVKKKMKTEASGKVLEGEELVLNTNNTEEVMLNTTKPEIGLDYEKQLKAFVKDFKGIMNIKTQWPKLNKTAIDFNEFKNDPHQNEKDFLHFSFEGTPTMAAVAIVSQMQTEVLAYEASALDTLNRIVRGTQLEFTDAVPMVRPEANTIIAGLEYKADLFIAASSSGAEPEMYMDSQKLPVELDPTTQIKMGKIKFKTSGGDYNKDGIIEKSFKTRIVVKGKPYDEVVKYKVVRPTAKFESESASTLYLDCGNEMSVSVAGMPDASGLTLSCSPDQGRIVSQGPGKFVLLPSRPNMDVKVLMNGSQIDVKPFKAKPAPAPSGKLMVGSAEYDVKKGIPPGTSVVRFNVDPVDEQFRRTNQKDAAYRVVSMTLQITGKTPVTINSGSIELTKYGLKPGDSFSIYNVQVVRSTWDPNDQDNKPVNANLSGSFIMSK